MERSPIDKLKHLVSIIERDATLTKTDKLDLVKFTVPMIIKELEKEKGDFCQCELPDREAGYTYCHNCHKHVSDERMGQLTKD